jgi:alkylated DNA nucleotide flippase Atl1
MEAAEPRTQDPHVLRAVASAWGWRRKIETGEVATIRDIAVAIKVSERFVSRTMRLAYLSPIVLERLVAHRRPCSLSIKDLIAAAERPWCEQEALVFES